MSDDLVGWQPIETAPKDGKRILVGRAGAPPIFVWWEKLGDGSFTWVGVMGALAKAPTHWFPIPKCPEVEVPENA